MPERKEIFTALENRDVDCATLQAKSPARKGVNQIIGMHASLVPALEIEVLGGKGTVGTYANYTTLYLIILCGKNTWILSISCEKLGYT